MTTKITVDAHAGWPVQVTRVNLDGAGKVVSHSISCVPPNTRQDVHVHSHLALILKEMQPGRKVDSDGGEKPAVLITEAQLAASLTRWEKDFRAGRTGSNEDRAKLTPEQVGQESARYLFNMLQEM